MTGMLIIAAILVLLGLLANRFGADSRDSRDWRNEPERRRSPLPEPLTRS